MSLSRSLFICEFRHQLLTQLVSCEMASIEPTTMKVELAKGSTTADTTLAARKRFNVNKWNAATLWTWDIVVDDCAICRNQIMNPCMECQAKQAVVPAEECTVAWGVCGHAYHFHCISRWLKIREVCPLGDCKWEYQRYGR